MKCQMLFFCFYKGLWFKTKKLTKLGPLTCYWTLEAFYLPVKLKIVLVALKQENLSCNKVNDIVLVSCYFWPFQWKARRRKLVWYQKLFMISLCVHRLHGIYIIMWHWVGGGVIILSIYFLSFDWGKYSCRDNILLMNTFLKGIWQRIARDLFLKHRSHLLF